MSTKEEQERWAKAWLKSVATGEASMSQRKRSSIEKHAGSINTVKRIAQELGVHLLLVEDDEGNELVAASTRPFKVLC